MSDQQDPNAGHGGSYVIDDATGERTLVERTQPAEQPEPAPEKPAEEQ